MIPFWKKTDKHSKPQSAQKRRQNAKPSVPRSAQQSIPMQRMFEDGTCRVKPNYYTRTISIRTSIISLPSRRIRLPFLRNGAVSSTFSIPVSNLSCPL